MKTQKLTKRVVDGITANGADLKIFDSQVPGFHVRVKPSGSKSYALKYRASGRQRNVTIGRHGLITPDQARSEAFRLLAAISDGDDPSAERKSALKDPTLEQFWEEYLERHAIPRKAPGSVKEDRNLWRLYIRPPLGHIKVNAITRQDITRLHASRRSTPYGANHMLCLLSKMMNLAVDWDYRSDNPCRGVKKFHEEPRSRYLTAAERDRLSRALEQEPDQVGAIAIWLCRLTGARKGEVLQARWYQFDLAARMPMWQIPASSTKQKRVNRKPLSKLAATMLAEWKARCPPSEAGWVIPGRDPEMRRADLNGPWRRVRKRAGLDDVRLHDLRHDFASIAVSQGSSLEIIGRYLGHSSIQTTQRYAHLQDDPLHAMAELIGEAF
jgi:integrase